MDFEYTDPETGKTYAWPWPGEDSYSVASIMSELGVAGEIGDVSLECVEGEEVAGALYLEQKDGEWYLTSDVAFDETYELTVVVDGKAYIVIVTDDQQGSALSSISITFKQDGGEATDTGGTLDGTYYVVLKNTIYYPGSYTYGWWSQVSLTDGAYSVPIDNATIKSFVDDKNVLSGTDFASYSDASNLNYVSADSIKLVKYSGSDADSEIRGYVLNNQTNNITEINNNSKIGGYTVSRAESIDSEGNYAFTAVKDPVFTVQGISFPTGETVSLADSYYLAIGYTENNNTVYNYYAQISADGTIGAIKDASGMTVTEIPQAAGFCLVKPVGSFSITSLNDIKSYINDASKIEKIEDAGEFDKYLISFPSNMTPDSRVYSITATKQRDYNVSLTFRDIDYNKLNDVTLDGDYYMLAKEGVTYKYYAPVTTSGTGIGTIRDANDQEVTDGMYGIDGIEFVKYTGTATMSNLSGQNPKLINGSLINGTYLLEIPGYAVNYSYAIEAIQQPIRTASIQFIDAAGADISSTVTLDGNYYIVAYDGDTAKYYAPVNGTSGNLTFYDDQSTPVAVDNMPYMSSFVLRKTANDATKLDDARGGTDMKMLLTGNDAKTYVVTYDIAKAAYEFKAAQTSAYKAVIKFLNKEGTEVTPAGVSSMSYKVHAVINYNDHPYYFLSSEAMTFGSASSVEVTMDKFAHDKYGNGTPKLIYRTAFDDVAVELVKGDAEMSESNGNLKDPTKALEIGDAIGAYALTSAVEDKANARTILTFQEVDPYNYTITTSDSSAIAFDSTANSGWYILSILKKADGMRSYHYVAPVTLQGVTTVTGTISTYYYNSDPSKITLASPASDTDTRSSVYVEGDTVSTVLVHMNTTPTSYKDILQLEENGNIKGEMFADGDGANCYTLDVTNSGNTSMLTLTKAVNPTVTVNFQDATGAAKASILTDDHYYLYVELDRGRGKANYGYVSGKLDLTKETQTFEIPYFRAADSDDKRAYLTDGNSYTVYVVKRTDSVPTVQWCQAGTGVIMYEKGDQIEKTVFDASSTVSKTAPYETSAAELNAVVNIKELPVLGIKTQFKNNDALEAPTFTGHRYDLLVTMTDAQGNKYYKLVPVDTTANPSAETTIPSFVTEANDGNYYFYTGAETIEVAVVQTPGTTAPGLHNAIHSEGGCYVFKEGTVTGDGYTVNSTLSGNVITTTLEKKTATATAFTADVTFYDKKGGTALTSLDPQLSGNYYMLATLNTGNETNGYTPVGYAIVDVTNEELNTANTTGTFSVDLPVATAYTILDANGNEVTGSTLSYDPSLYTMSIRLFNTTEDNVPATYADAKAGNDTVDGYDFWSNTVSGDGSSADIRLYKAYKKKYQIQLDFSEPITIDSSDALHIKVEAEHATTGTDVFETDVTGAELSTWLHVIEDQTKTPIEQHWEPTSNTFSGNEKVTISLFRNGQVIAQGARVYDYTVNYEPETKRTEVNDDNARVTTITDYVKLTKIPTSYDYNFYTILGDGVGYGITADYLYQNGHIQSNFATNYYYGNNIIEPDLAGHGAIIVIADYALKEGKALEIGGSHVAGTDTVIYLGNGGTLDLVKNVADRPWVHVVPSSTEDLTDNVVNPIINHMQQISEELLTHNITLHPDTQFIDLLDFPEDSTIYLDGDELNFWLGKGDDGLFIKKHKNQTIVFNYDSADTAKIGQYHVAYAEGEDAKYYGDKYFATHSPTGKGDADNVFADELAKHIVYNLNSVKHITADTIVGMVLVPREDSTMNITGTSAGWVISAGYVTNSGAEWHSVYADMPDSSTTDLTIFKMIDATEEKPNGTTPGKYQVFTFSLDHLITTGGEHVWHPLDSQNNSSRTVKFSSISEMEEGWNVYKITETGAAPGSVGSYVYDQRSVYAFVRYFTVGGRVMVAGMPRYYMQMDENDAPAVEEFTFDMATFNPSKETLRQAVGEDNTTGVHLKAMNIPTFNNITKRDGLEVKKVVTGTNNPNARFIFQIDLWQTPVGEDAVRIFPDIEGTPTNSRTYPMTGVAGETEITFSKVDTNVQDQEYARATLTLKANQTAHISGIPVGANYTVTELSTVADVTDENKDEAVEFNGTTGVSNGYTLTSKTDDEGVIIENEAKTATFTNAYHAEGDYTITASKTMLGRDMEDGEFFFIVEQGGETKLSGQTSGTGSSANISWGDPGKLTFDQNDVGTHTYIIKEDLSRLPSGVAPVGDGEIEIQLQIVDNLDGTLTVTRVNDNDAQISFQNTLKTEVTLVGTKTLVGRNMEEGETFTFNVTERVDNEDVIVATGTAVGPANANDPVNITFTPITYLFDGNAENYPKTHTYTITEDETGLGRGVSNTTGHTFTATVREIYNATAGTFTASAPVYSDSDIAFVNTWEERGMSFSVTKEWKREGVEVFAPRTITFSVTQDGTNFDLTDVTIEKTGEGSFTKSGNTVTLTAGASEWPTVTFKNVPEATYVVNETAHTGEGTGNDVSTNYALNGEDKASNTEAAATQDGDEVLIKNAETIPSNNKAQLTLKKVWDESVDDADRETVTYELYQVAASGTSESSGSSSGDKEISIKLVYGDTEKSTTVRGNVGDTITISFSGLYGVDNTDDQNTNHGGLISVSIDENGRGTGYLKIIDYTNTDVIFHIYYSSEESRCKAGMEVSASNGNSVPLIVETLTATPTNHSTVVALGGTKYGEYTLDQTQWTSGITIDVPKATGSTKWQYYVVEKDGDKYQATYTKEGDNTLVVTNNKKEDEFGKLALQKLVSADASLTVPDGTYTFTVQKVTSEDYNVADSTFETRTVAITFQGNTAQSATVAVGSGAATATTITNGVVTLEGLEPGWYKISEGATNNGTVLTDITVTNPGATYTGTLVVDGVHSEGGKPQYAVVYVDALNDPANAKAKATFTNSYEKGALKFTKIVTVNDVLPTSDTFNKVDGIYTFTVAGPKPSTDVVKTVIIAINKGKPSTYTFDGDDIVHEFTQGETYVTIGDLLPGDYVVTETQAKEGVTLKTALRGDSNAEAVSADKAVTVHVTGGVTTPANDSAAAASFTNNANSDNPTVTKTVWDINDTTGQEGIDESSEKTFYDSADHDIDDNIPYRIECPIPSTYQTESTYKFELYDKMQNLRYQDGGRVYFAIYHHDTGMTDYYDVTHAFDIKPDTTKGTNGVDSDNYQHIIVKPKTGDLKATLNDITGYWAGANYHAIINHPLDIVAGDTSKSYKFSDHAANDTLTKIEFRYSAKFDHTTTSPNYGSTGNRNEAWYKYGANGETLHDVNKVFTYKLEVDKTKFDGITGMAGAQFTLTKAVKDSEPVTVTVKTANDGKKFIWDGLDDGTYTLTETAPEGYLPIAPITFTISAEHDPTADDPSLRGLRVETNTSNRTYFKNVTFSADANVETGEVNIDDEAIKMTIPNVEKVDVPVTKVWSGPYDEKKIEYIEYEISRGIKYYDAEEEDYRTALDGDFKNLPTSTVIIKADNYTMTSGNTLRTYTENGKSWNYTWTDLPKYGSVVIGVEDEETVVEKTIKGEYVYKVKEKKFSYDGKVYSLSNNLDVLVKGENGKTVTAKNWSVTLDGNTFTNTLASVDIEVNKAWAPENTWPLGVTGVTVKLQQSVNGSTPTDVAGKTLTLNAANSAVTQAAVEAMPEKTEAEKTEKTEAQALLDQRFFKNLPKYDDSGNLITYSVIETAVTGTNASLTDFNVSYSPENTTTGGVITVTNTVKPISLKVIKVEKGTSTKLPGAEFQLTRKNAGGTYEVFKNNAFGNYVDGNTTYANKGPFSVGVTGEITIQNLLPGEYKLKETKAPAGYIITTGDIDFTINLDGTVTVANQPANNEGKIVYSDLVTFTQKTASEAAGVTIGNQKGAALPATGGMGTGLIYATGVGLLLLAVIGWVLREKRRAWRG